MLIPMLVCQDAAAEIAFCEAAFGAKELSRRAGSDGSVVHATLAIGPLLVMVHNVFPGLASQAPMPDGSSPVVLYLYADEVDAVVTRSIAAGARLLLAPADQAWRSRCTDHGSCRTRLEYRRALSGRLSGLRGRETAKRDPQLRPAVNQILTLSAFCVLLAISSCFD